MIKIPPYLKKGDTIGIVCPSGQMPFEKAATCIEVLKQWGYHVVVGKTLGSQFHYFSGTDEERLADLQQMLDDDSINAILCGRGGYGMSRIVDQLDFSRFRKKPKWVIGFSDITVLHAHIYNRHKTACLHAPMAGAFNEGEYENEFIQSLRKAIAGKKSSYSCAAHPFNRKGKAEGILIGGNLSLIAHIIGSKSAFSTKGKILFLEDVGEYIYNVDRMFIQLKRSGMLDELAGLIIGGFSEMKDTLIPFGSDVFDLISEHVAGYDYPVCYDFPVSHERNNYALKVGLEHTFHVTAGKVTLKEI
ncbi:S66 peptidase family protein [Sediminibacterium ginsengisoli]|uniref:Muramoyltetrapeptide carboxypeptidase n=1 Tax=Sediminibacterium ginsengisoli TaxID=413434 RepID=A0A1T4K6L4_9BACT|nr:LD-carboxypeptidase [Sediminibacterium ginsengisoli]SJZ38056.1 muramoyltetrapeptide carboxypeptidase [Sediminibacterium ginsengisoli]